MTKNRPRKNNVGKIQKKGRKWTVNAIDIGPTDKVISWRAPSTITYQVLLPIEILTKTKSVIKIPMVKSKAGLATYGLPSGGLKRPRRKTSDNFFYCILVHEGNNTYYVHGNTPPRIIIWGYSPK